MPDVRSGGRREGLGKVQPWLGRVYDLVQSVTRYVCLIWICFARYQ